MTRSRAGYSLFEVLLAFAVMAMILSVLLPRQTDLLGRIKGIDERLLAQDYALSQLDALGVSNPWTIGETQGSYRDWTLRQSVEESPLPGTDLPAATITITILSGTGTVLAEVIDRRLITVESPGQ